MLPLRLIALLLLLCLSGAAQAQIEKVSEIKPPFGLAWGEAPDRLERLLTGAKATIIQRRILDDGREAWDVEGISQAGLRRTIFYFSRNELGEVELQYQHDQWTEERYNQFMGDVRKRIEQRYGPGQQIVRKNEQEAGTQQNFVGHKWNLNNTALQLFYFAAQNGPHVFRTLSVHYRAY